LPARLITPPSGEPVTLAEAKAHLRLDTALDDSSSLAHHDGAPVRREGPAGAAFLAQTWELVQPGFGAMTASSWASARSRHHLLPAGYEWFRGERSSASCPSSSSSAGTSRPALAADAVKYIDNERRAADARPSIYTVDNVHVPARLQLAYGSPGRRPGTSGTRCGCSTRWAGPTPRRCPLALKQAMLLLIAQMYEHRTPEVAGVLSVVQFSIDALLDPYRLNTIG
jgi:hypothetical protein